MFHFSDKELMAVRFLAGVLAILILVVVWKRLIVVERPAHTLHIRAVPIQPAGAEETLEQPKATTPASAPAQAQTDTSRTRRVHVNRADLKALQSIPGIGSVLAGRIYEYRRAHGPFKQPEELMKVNGIGSAKLEAIRPYISLE